MKFRTCAVVACMAVIAWFTLTAPADARRRTFTFETDTAFAVSGDVWIRVDNPVGDVTILAGASSQIKVRRLARIAASDSSHAADFLDDIEMRYRPGDDGVDIEANVRREDRTYTFFDGLLTGKVGRRIDIDLEIEIPTACNVRLRTTSGDIDLADIEGDLEIEASSGDMTIEDVRGELQIEGSSGDVWLSHVDANTSIELSSGDLTVKRMTGSLTAITSSGDISIRDVQGDLEAQTTTGDQTLLAIIGSVRARASSGDIECSSEEGDVDVRTSSGDARIDAHLPSEGHCRVMTGSGDVTLRLAEHPGAKIDITTGSGDSSDRMDIRWQRKSARHRLGTFGDGDAIVQIETGSGDIRLEGTP